MPRSKSAAVLPFNLGLYYDKSPLSVPVGALQDGRNFRIRKGRISNTNLGWRPWSAMLGSNNENTKVLLHFNEADGSTTFHDSAIGQGGPPWRRWSAQGDAETDDAQSVFGGASLLCDGTGDYAEHADDADFTIGSNDFFISIRFQYDGATTEARRLAGQCEAAFDLAQSAWMINMEADDTMRFIWSDGTAAHAMASTTPVANDDLFHHLLVSRDGDNWYLFYDGILEATTTVTGPIQDSAETLKVGAADGGATWFGWIDEFNLTVGETVVAEFNPPSSPYQPALSGPVMLIEEFASRGSPVTNVIATTRDVYEYDRTNDFFRVITPQYNTATVDVSNASPAVVVPDTGSPTWVTAGIKPGDYIHFGATAQDDPSAAWYEIDTVDNENQLTLTTAVTGTPFNAVNYVIRRRTTGDVTNRWDTDTFVAPDDGTGDDMIFLTNGVEDVITWTVQDDYAVYRPALGFKAKQLRIFKSMMLYGNLTIAGTRFPTTFINSDVGKPLDVVGGLASEFRAHDGVDEIHEMEDLGDNMVFYSERHLTIAQFVGDPLIFIFRQASTGIGPLGPDLVADFGDYHEFLGADSQYLFDGVSVNEVGTQVWREILRARDASRQTLGFIHFDEENGDLLWAIPLAADSRTGVSDAPPEEAVVEHYLEIESERISDPFSRRNLPFVCGGYSFTIDVLTWDQLAGTWEDQTINWDESILGAAFPINLMGGEDGIIYVINVSQFANGEPMASWIRTGRRPMVDGRVRGVLRRVYPFAFLRPGTLQVISRYSDHASGPVTDTETNTFDLTLPQGQHFVTPYRRGRFCELEFRRDDGDPYELEGYDVDVIANGGIR